MNKTLPDLPSYTFLLDYYREYVNPDAKIAREVRAGTIIRIKRDFYITKQAIDGGLPRSLIANCLYGPSYVSFESALRFYGLIPEGVPGITSATLGKHRSKRFITPLGSFFYRDVSELAYPEDVVWVTSGRWKFLIATKEKAICDKLSKIPGVRTKKEIEMLLFEDLRIDEHEFSLLDTTKLSFLIRLYQSTTLKTLRIYLGL